MLRSSSIEKGAKEGHYQVTLASVIYAQITPQIYDEG